MFWILAVLIGVLWELGVVTTLQELVHLLVLAALVLLGARLLVLVSQGTGSDGGHPKGA